MYVRLATAQHRVCTLHLLPSNLVGPRGPYLPLKATKAKRIVDDPGQSLAPLILCHIICNASRDVKEASPLSVPTPSPTEPRFEAGSCNSL